jgi:1-acyl-sn-glycerol-3-phosphate acyltransferase
MSKGNKMTCQGSAERPGFFRAALYAGPIFLSCFMVGLLCIMISLFRPKSRANYWIIRTWARLVIWICGIRIDVRGAENIPSEGSFLVMSTHKSHLDIPVLIREIPRQFRIVAKKSLFKIPVFGWAMTIAGYINVDRDDRQQAFASLDKAADEVREGMPLLIFPEGTRSPDGSLGPFKKGGFVLGTKAKMPLIPVLVDGTYDILPKTTWRISPGRVRVVFGAPIDTNAYSLENKEELMERVRQAMSGMK